MPVSKELKVKPQDVAAKIAAAIPPNNFLEKAEVAGAGFINMHIKKDVLQHEITKVRGWCLRRGE